MRWLCVVLLAVFLFALPRAYADELDDFVADKVQMNPAEPRIPDEARSKRKALAPAPPPRVVEGKTMKAAPAIPATQVVERSAMQKSTPWRRYALLSAAALAILLAIAAHISRRK